MTKDELLRKIASDAYNVGFGAKKNYSSHDIIVKLPSWIGFITLAIGILQLCYTCLAESKELSAGLIIVGIAAIYLSIYNSNVDLYRIEGDRLTRLFNRLTQLYLIVKGKANTDPLDPEVGELSTILNEYYSNNIAKQVFLSQWYAHFKFFGEMQIDWVDEQLHFKFFRDKVPNSLKVFLIVILLLILFIALNEYIYCF
jgi:hypothetical protein